MNCLPCFGSKESESNEQQDLPAVQTKGHPSSQPPVVTMEPPSRQASQPNSQNHGIVATNSNETNEVGACNFGFRDLAMATKNFRRESLLGESRVGKLYKGTLRTTGQNTKSITKVNKNDRA
ncbi:hypothetical protein R6Q57_001720 [Mikania cordata]